MLRPYQIRVDDEPRAVQPIPDLIRAIREGDRDARHVDDLSEHACMGDANALQQATGGECGQCEHDPIRVVRRASGDRHVPA